MFSARVICDSLAPSYRRGVSMVVTMPQMIEQEFLRHRVMCCSFSSTRAIPIKLQIRSVMENPFIPLSWGKSGKGMSAKEELNADNQERARNFWLHARNEAVAAVERLTDTHSAGMTQAVHKQIAGRLLQPFAWRTGVITATDWFNFFYLRVHPDAQPEIQYFAYLCLKAYLASTPNRLEEGDWHLPFVDNTADMWKCESDEERCMVSAARCARSSYNRLPTPEEWLSNPEPQSEYYTPDIIKDMERAKELRDGSGGIGHWSPFEHQLQARGVDEGHIKSGPMHGFITFRSTIDTGATIEKDLNVYDLRRLAETYEQQNPLLAL